MSDTIPEDSAMAASHEGLEVVIPETSAAAEVAEKATSESPSKAGTPDSAGKVTKEWKKSKFQELRAELAKSPFPSPRTPPENASPPSETKGSGKNGSHKRAFGSITNNNNDSSVTVPAVISPVAAVSAAKEAVTASPPNGVNAAASGVLSDIEKKHRRAERFGVSLQLTEEEKRKSRAARFAEVGNNSTAGDSKAKEEEKRKARAERFGLSTNSSADEEAKKKARLARFSQDSKPVSSEEEKKKERAARFNTNVDDNNSTEVDENLKPAVAAEAVASS